ncbi:chitinase [Flagelloscypha sp. PMI_526]|nr:chitinase [Flagelloscypha sp. PMI_526]
MTPLRAVLCLISTCILVSAVTVEHVRDDIRHSKNQRIAAAWYAGWHAEDFPLSHVPWAKYTHLTYAFAETTPDVNQLMVGAEELLPDFVRTAKAHGVKPLVSIGGWTGSLYFSSDFFPVQWPRLKIVRRLSRQVSNLAAKYELAGIDFDWEYPGGAGIGCNTNSASDTANFLLFLQELRQDKVGRNLLLSAATAITPFPDENGEYADMSAFGKIFDWLAIMNYDINVRPSFFKQEEVLTAFQRAIGMILHLSAQMHPLRTECAPDDKEMGSATDAIDWWTGAGFPVNKLVLAVPSYGHSYIVPKENALKTTHGHQGIKLYAEFDPEQYPRGDAWDDEPAVDACGVQEPQGGNWDFWGMVKGGFLREDGRPATWNPEISYLYDKCSETPFIYNSTSEVMISYDDAASALAKGKFVQKHGLAGFSIWEAGGDYKDILLDAYRKGSGIW